MKKSTLTPVLAPVALPGVEGRVGAWSIYRLPRGVWPPIRIGETDIGDSEAVAVGMAKAKAIATAVAASLTAA